MKHLCTHLAIAILAACTAAADPLTNALTNVFAKPVSVNTNNELLLPHITGTFRGDGSGLTNLSGATDKLDSTNAAHSGLFTSTLSSSDTESLRTTLTLKRQTTGTAAAGIGNSITFYNSDSIGQDSYSAYIAALLTDATSGQVDSALSFATKENGGTMTERVRVRGDGNVGIGKTNPEYPLDVQGTARATAFIGDGSGLTGVISSSDTTTWSLVSSNSINSAFRKDITTGSGGMGSHALVRNDIAQPTFTRWAHGDGTGAFSGGCFDGQFLWFAPYDGSNYFRFSTIDATITKYTHSLGYPMFSGVVFDGVSLWFIPHSCTNVVKMDPANTNRTYYPHTYTNTAFAFSDGVFDGTYIWMIPLGATNLVRITPGTGAMTAYACNYGSEAFSSGVWDGQYLWLIPYKSTKLVKFNPVNSEIKEYSHGQWANAFRGAVFDGTYIWCVPGESDNILKINVFTDAMETIAHGQEPSGSPDTPSLFAGGAFDGVSIWFAPRHCPNFIRINPLNNAITEYPSLELTGYDGSFNGMIWDGSALWCVPYYATNIVRIIPPESKSQRLSSQVGLNISGTANFADDLNLKCYGISTQTLSPLSWTNTDLATFKFYALGSTNNYNRMLDIVAAAGVSGNLGGSSIRFLTTSRSTSNTGPSVIIQDTGRVDIRARITEGMTLGSPGGTLNLLESTAGAYGLYAGVSGTGDSWIQSARSDGATTTSALRLNEKGGNVSIGTNTAPETLTITGTNATTIGAHPPDATSYSSFQPMASANIYGVFAGRGVNHIGTLFGQSNAGTIQLYSVAGPLIAGTFNNFDFWLGANNNSMFKLGANGIAYFTNTVLYTTNISSSGSISAGTGGSNIQTWEKVTAQDSSEAGIAVHHGSKSIYLYNGAGLSKLDAWNYGTGLPVDIYVGGNGGSVYLANLVKIDSAGAIVAPGPINSTNGWRVGAAVGITTNFTTTNPITWTVNGGIITGISYTP